MNTFERMLHVCQAVFEGDIDISAITPQSNLRDDIGINSIGLLYMAMALEEEFGIKFVNDDFIGLTTVNDVITCVEKKVNQ